jgi:hypothetical protein
MNVIRINNLKTLGPSREDMADLRASLTAFAGPDDPLTVSLSTDNWPGRSAVHRVHYAGLQTLTGLKELDENKLGPVGWRFFAAGHAAEGVASACMTTSGSPGAPAKVMAITRGPAPAEVLNSTELLNELSDLTGNPNNQYELRVLRMPSLGIEVFWLKAVSDGLVDLIVPYGWIPANWNLAHPSPDGKPAQNQATQVVGFLKLAADAARERLAKPDIAQLANRPRAQKAPVDAAARELHLPKPGESFSLAGVYWAEAPLISTGPAKIPKPRSEPERAAKVSLGETR